MPYEALSRALAYVSCFTTMTLFATSMAVAAVNAGKLKPPLSCGGQPCAAIAAKAAPAGKVETVAVLIPAKF